MNIDVSDFGLYLNIAFFSVLLIGFVFGLIRGFRKSLYRFIITLIFFAVFFLTVNAVVGWFYTANIGFLNNLYSQYLPVQGEITSIQDVVHLFLVDAIGEGASIDTMGDEVMALIDALGIFVVKIAYTIVYFTVFQIIYRFILFIVGLLIFAKGRAKNKKGKRNRPMGAVFGTLTAALNLFVMLIVLSGIMSIGESLATLEIDNVPSQVSFEPDQYSRITDINDSLQPVGRLRYQEMAENDPNTQLTEALDSLKSLIEVYNSNIVIQGLNAFQVEDEFTGENENMAIVLFDEVISINYKDEKIDLRQDIKSFAEVASLYLNSDYYQSGDLSDITSQEITNAFSTLSDSKLLVTLIPVGIEFGINQMEDSPIVIDDDFRNLIYEDINWKTEINQLGVVASAGFMILENANALAEGTDFKTVVFSPTLTETMFDELGNSKIAEYGSFVALEYLMESNETLQSVITVPDDLNFADEFRTFGDIANEILSQNLTIADIENAEGQDLLLLFSGLDLEVLMNSKLTTNALVNILTGQTSINIDIEFLEIPDLTRDEWFDTLGTDGELIEAGELRHILASISILTSYLDEIDLDDIQPADLGTLSEEDIDSMFESKVLVASISNAIITLDTGGFTLIIPDSVLDLDGYIKKEEVKSLLKSITLIVEETACAPDDDTCSDTGFDIGKAFTLSDDNIRKLLAENVNPDDEYYESEIFYATAANMLTDMTDQVVVPDDVKVSISVDSSPLEVVSKSEILNAFLAIKAIGITDIENTDFDASLLLNLSIDPDSDPTTLDTTKTSAIFASKILHATISKFLLDQTGDNATVIVPKLASEDYEGTTTDIALINDTVGGVEYISEEEFTQFLEAVLLLQLNDFTNLDIAPADLLEHAEELLDSAILHATITDQIYQQITGGAVTVPDTDVDGNPLFITTSENDEYIVKSELNAIFNALDLLDITDFNSISLDTISLDVIIINDDALLDSAILHATISNQIIDLEASTDVVIPEINESEVSIISEDNTDLTDIIKYLAKQEIKDFLAAIVLIDNDPTHTINDITGTVDLALFLPSQTAEADGNQDILFASSIMKATVSKQVFALEDGLSGILVPEVNQNNDSIIIPDGEGDGDAYLVKAELKALINATDLVTNMSQISDFDGDIDLSVFFKSTYPSSPETATANQDTLLSSSIMQATISNKFKDLDNNQIFIPSVDVLDQTIEYDYIGTGDYFIEKEEVKSLINVLDIVGFSNIESFDGVIDLSVFDDEGNQNALLASAIMHQTVSKKIIDNASLDVPNQGFKHDDNSVYTVLITKAANDFDFIDADDIRYLIDVMNLISTGGDVGSFTASVDTSIFVDSLNQDILLKSAVMHYTVSNQIKDNNQLVVPEVSLEADNTTNETVIDLAGSDEFIVRDELKELIDVINLISSGSIDGFSSSFSLSTFAEGTKNDPGQANTNQEMLLMSAIMHATISDQVIGMDDSTSSSVLIAPDYNFSDSQIKISATGSNLAITTTYYTQTEISNLIDGLNSLGLGSQSITSFDGGLSISTLNDPGVQSDLYASSILHATISNQIINNNSLDVPDYSLESNLSNVQIVYTTTDSENYILSSEITALIDVMNLVGTGGDVNGFSGNVDLSVFDEDTNPGNQDTLLTSAIMHATVSKQILDLPDEVLLVPTYTEDGAIEANRIYHEVSLTTNITEYIIKSEVKAIITGFNQLGASDLGSYNSSSSINAGDFFSDIATYLESSSFQATISKKILDGNSGNLIIPNRDETNTYDIQIDVYSEITSANMTYIESQEIEYLVNGLNELSITDFSSSVSPTSITTLTAGQLDVILLSGTLHLTIEDIIQGNGNISSDIPDKALDDLYNLTDILIKSEVKAFILASKAFAGNGADLSSIDFDFTTIAGKDEATRNTIIASMIVRNIITPEIESADASDPFFTLQASDYEDGLVTTFLTADGIRRYIDHLNSL